MVLFLSIKIFPVVIDYIPFFLRMSAVMNIYLRFNLDIVYYRGNLPSPVTGDRRVPKKRFLDLNKSWEQHLTYGNPLPTTTRNQNSIPNSDTNEEGDHRFLFFSAVATSRTPV
jgi:hypothetical protein